MALPQSCKKKTVTRERVKVTLLQRGWMGEHGDRKGSPRRYTVRLPRHCLGVAMALPQSCKKKTVTPERVTVFFLRQGR